MLDRYRNWFYKTRFSIFVSALVKSRVHPNLLTVLGLVFGIFAAYLIFKRYFLVSIVFLILTALCDMCDGWVARLSRKTTKFGVIFDVTVDKYVEGFIGLAFAFVAPQVIFPAYIWVVIAVFGSIIISLVSNIGFYLSKKSSFKIVSRFDRGVIIVIGLLLARFFGNIFLTYTIILIAILSHLTVLSLVIDYYKILKKNKL